MSSQMRVAGRKDVREEAAILARFGFRYQGLNSAGHLVFDHPQHGELFMANSPSAFYWRRSHRRLVAKTMGITLTDLECLIHGQARPSGKRTGGRPRRSRRERPTVALRHLHVAPETLAAPPAEPEPEPEPIPVVKYEPTDPITETRRDQWARLQAEHAAANLANPFPWPSSRRAA